MQKERERERERERVRERERERTKGERNEGVNVCATEKERREKGVDQIELSQANLTASYFHLPLLMQRNQLITAKFLSRLDRVSFQTESWWRLALRSVKLPRTKICAV